jgi:predicted dehydrogenase
MALKVAVVGCGGVARGSHLPAWKRVPDIELVAMCDKDKARADAAARDFGGKPYYDLEEMLSKEKLDIADVCTREPDHCAPVLLTLGHHVNTVVEKPMYCKTNQLAVQWSDLKEAQKMLDAWKKSKAKLAMNFNYRHTPHGKRMKQLIDSGELGKPVAIVVHAHLWCWSHVIDLMRWFMGDVTELGAAVSGLPDKMERSAWLQFKNGCTGSITGTWHSSMVHAPLRIDYTGDKARATVYNLSGSIEVYGHGGPCIPGGPVDKKVEFFGDGLRSEFGVNSFIGSLSAFARAVREGTEYAPSGLDGYRELEIDAGIFESAKSGKKIKFKV